MSTTPELRAGRLGNLTPDQEEKLRQLWRRLFQLFNQASDGEIEQSGAGQPALASELPSTDDKTRKKRGGSLFGRKSQKVVEAKQQNNSDTSIGHEDPDDKYGLTKQFYDTIATMKPEALRETVWSMVKHDHPDALCLRFLRARKWDVDKALIMLVSTMNWRGSQMHVDDDIMKNGEAGALVGAKSDDPKTQKVASDFLAQLRQGKSFLHGVDKNGSPVCIIRVRLHKIGEQSEEGLERYTIYLIETARMLLRPPVDTAHTMVFDMSGFSMSNMDYTPVKFIIKCFEANYPESLSSVLVHRAPWVFQGIWKIIKGWLDPVVANKITFTNNVKDLEEFIPARHIITELGGQEEWEYQYAEPAAEENRLMRDTATRDRLLAARSSLIREFEENTKQWVQQAADKDAEVLIKLKRDELASRLREDYWRLDPYIRARSLYDRTGILQGDKVDFYLGTRGSTSNGGVTGTSIGDLD